MVKISRTTVGIFGILGLSAAGLSILYLTNSLPQAERSTRTEPIVTDWALKWGSIHCDSEHALRRLDEFAGDREAWPRWFLARCSHSDRTMVFVDRSEWERASRYDTPNYVSFRFPGEMNWRWTDVHRIERRPQLPGTESGSDSDPIPRPPLPSEP